MNTANANVNVLTRIEFADGTLQATSREFVVEPCGDHYRIVSIGPKRVRPAGPNVKVIE